MSKREVEVTVAGRKYRLNSTLEEQTLHRLARSVESRLQGLAPGQQIHPQALLLAAMSLAYELEQAQQSRVELKMRSRQHLEEMLRRVDEALGSVDENGDPLPSAP